VLRSAASTFDRADARFVPARARVVGLGLALFEVGCGAGAARSPTAKGSRANAAIAANL
jgi:hypothetical protein